MKLGTDVRNAISWFAHSLIAGDLGPDDSRYSRDQLFLKGRDRSSGGLFCQSG